MKLVKKILFIVVLLFSLLGITEAIVEYVGGYDEISATVNHTWKAKKKRSPKNKYTIVWNDLEGKSHQGGSYANKYGYEEGDEIVIKVDKKTHEHLYAPTSHLVISIMLFVIVMLLFLHAIRKEGKCYERKQSETKR